MEAGQLLVLDIVCYSLVMIAKYGAVKCGIITVTKTEDMCLYMLRKTLVKLSYLVNLHSNLQSNLTLNV